MSDVYIQRLRGVQMEFNAARESIRYVQRNWQSYDIYADLPSLKPVHFEEAGRSVEVTYFVRLYAEFEGILKDHLATNHPAVVAPDKPKVDKLISLVTNWKALKWTRPCVVRWRRCAITAIQSPTVSAPPRRQSLSWMRCRASTNFLPSCPNHYMILQERAL